jgi:SAM-dependent methyltransferase
MNPNQALWEKGDFTQISSLMRASGARLVASLGVVPPLRVLDLGCGDGTTAVPLAQLGAQVTGIDIARNLVEAGNRRAVAAGLTNLTFQEGDACHLQDVEDDSFDLSISVFGAMFAPAPFDVARELVRVTRPGGRIVMANWIPDDPTSYVSQVLKISAAYTPAPPEGFVSPMTWGVESHILARFAQAGIAADQITMVKDTFSFAAPDITPVDLIDRFRRFYGPTMNAFDAAEKAGTQDELRQRLVALATAQNTAVDGGIAIAATFMKVTVQL